MKKIFLGTSVVAVTLMLSACGCKGPSQQSSTTENAPAVAQAPTQAENGGVINSIKDAMGLGKKMECTYTNKMGDKEISYTMQVDGKNFKTTSEIDGKKMYSVMKDEVMYTWGGGNPIASKIDIACMQEIAKNLPKNPDGTTPTTPNAQDPQKAFDTATNVSCQPSDAIDISVPSDIQFQDMCDFIKAASKGMPAIPKDIKVPGGVNIPANIPGGIQP